jgi:hypothetical protein
MLAQGDISMQGSSQLLVVAGLVIAGCPAPIAMAGNQSVALALAAINRVAGTYGRNVAIATGEWAEAIDRKLLDLRRAKKRC